MVNIFLVVISKLSISFSVQLRIPFVGVITDTVNALCAMTLL